MINRHQPKVDSNIAKSLFRDLSGFPGYPKSEQGEAHYIEAFQDASISVDHARAIIAAFDEKMPTLREIRDTALNLRPRFEPSVNQRAEWEKQYGPPVPGWSKNLIGSHDQQKRKMLWQAIRDAVFYTEGPGRFRLTAMEDHKQRRADIEFWTRGMARMCKVHAEELAAFRVELAERGWDDVMKTDWANEVQPVAEPVDTGRKLITQADVDRVKAGTAVADDDDPDRWE